MCFGEIFNSIEGRCLIGLVTIGLIAVPFSVWPSASLTAWRKYLALNFILFITCAANIKSEKEVKIQLWGILFCGFELAVGVLVFPIALMGEAGLRISTTQTYDANDIGLIFVTILPLAVSMLFYEKGKIKKAFILATIGMMCAGILRTGSRGALIGFGVIALLFLFYKIGRISFFKKALILSSALLVIVSITPSEVIFNRFTILLKGEDYNLQIKEAKGAAPGRLEIWTKGITLLGQYPIFGVGTGEFADALGNKFGGFYYMTGHNTFLQILVEMGPLGLVLLLTMIIAMLKNSKLLKSSQDVTPTFHICSKCLNISIWGFISCGMMLSAAYTPILFNLLALSYGMKRTGMEMILNAQMNSEYASDNSELI